MKHPKRPGGARGEEGTEVTEELSAARRVAGIKQVRRALESGSAARVYIAQDADPRLLQPLVQRAVDLRVPVEQVPTMKELGRRCGISVGAAVAARLR